MALWAQTQIAAIEQALSPAAADPSTYGGEVEDPATGTVTLYVTAGGMSQATALIGAAGDNSLVNVVTVGRSYQTLEALESLINADSTQIDAAGIGMKSWMTDVANNTIDITVTSPLPAATSYLDNLYGQGAVSISSVPTAEAQDTSGRFSDSPPYSEADEIYLNGNSCSSAFYYTGNNSGNVFGLTAGHCPTGTVTVNGGTVGHTSTDYLNSGGPDVQSYTCTSNGSTCNGNAIWYGPTGGNYYYVRSQCGGSCGLGSLITADGDQNGGNQVTDNTVKSTDASYNEPNGVVEKNLGYACNASTPPAVGGDSGGAVYQRQSDGTVWADGMIIAQGTNIQPCLGEYGMFYDQLANVMGLVNGTLYTGT